MLQRKQVGLWTMVTAMVVVTLASAWAVAQQGEQRPGRDRGTERSAERGAERGGEDRGGDWAARREEMQRRMAERMKEALGASDEEWGLLQPMIEKVTTLQAASRGVMGMGMMGGRRGGQEMGPAGQPGERGQSELTKAQQELRSVLDNPNAGSSEIKTKLDAMRAAREKNKKELASAQNELREVLNVRQEAQLVMMGLLE